MNGKHIWLVLSVVLALSAGTVVGGIVGVDSSGAVYTGVGVLDTTSRTWSGTSFTLEGNTVTVDYGGAANMPHRGGGAPTLFEQMRYKGDGSVTYDVTLSNLNTAFAYDLVVYGVDRWTGAGPRGSKYEVLGSGLGAKETDYLATSASFIEDENYVRFDGLSAPTGTITFRVSEGTVGNKISMLNGFEIESVSTGPPPPPPPANSILQYGFDFTSGTVASNGGTVNDDSGNGNDAGVIQGNGGTYNVDIPTANVQNATGVGSLGTGNGNYIATAGDIVTFADIIGDGGLTLEAWTKGGGGGLILSIEGVYSLQSTAGGGAFVDGFDNANRRVDASFDRSEWHHLAGVLSDPYMSGTSMYADMALYVDGVLAGTLPNVQVNADLNRAAAVGNHPLTGINEPFGGLVYEPRISLGALIPSQFTYGTASAPIPEPVTMTLLGLAVAGVGGYVRRRRRA